ncbi:hypothetical protein Tco_1327588 [Tanacetum coccineum]
MAQPPPSPRHSHLKFLGHVIDSEGIHVDPAKIESIKDWASPKTPTEIRQFLGLVGYYRQFIESFFENRLTYDEVDSEKHEKEVRNFSMVTAMLRSKGLDLSFNEGECHSYESRQLKVMRRTNHTDLDLRLERSVYALKIWIIMRQRRWLELLSDYDCEIRYHPRKANVVADALSRKERIKPLRVRALVVTIGLNLPKQILNAQAEARKEENYVAKDLHGMINKLEPHANGMLCPNSRS